MEVGGDRDGRTQNLYRLPVFQAALCPERQPSVHASGRGPLCPSAAEKPPFCDTGLPVLPGEDGQVVLAACCGVPTRRGRFRAPARAKGRIPPPFSFRLAEKKSAVDGVKEKGVFPDEPGKSWPCNRVFIGFRPRRGRTVLFPRCPLRCALVRRSVKPKFPPHHGQQEGKRSNCSLVLASQFSQAGRRTIGSAKVGSPACYRYGG